MDKPRVEITPEGPYPLILKRHPSLPESWPQSETIKVSHGHPDDHVLTIVHNFKDLDGSEIDRIDIGNETGTIAQWRAVLGPLLFPEVPVAALVPVE